MHATMFGSISQRWYWPMPMAKWKQQQRNTSQSIQRYCKPFTFAFIICIARNRWLRNYLAEGIKNDSETEKKRTSLLKHIITWIADKVFRLFFATYLFSVAIFFSPSLSRPYTKMYSVLFDGFANQARFCSVLCSGYGWWIWDVFKTHSPSMVGRLVCGGTLCILCHWL